jgi:hypothetical protein
MDFADIYLLAIVSVGMVISYKIMRDEEKEEKAKMKKR